LCGTHTNSDAYAHTDTNTDAYAYTNTHAYAYTNTHQPAYCAESGDLPGQECHIRQWHVCYG